jgi:cytoskeletal protein CcmA (bactofilin family)
MAFSGGTFSRTFDCTTDRDNGVKILASKFDTELDGFATGLSTCILKDGTQTCTAAIPFAEGLTVPDNKTIVLGTNSDITIQYDESTNDSLEIAANVEGAALGIVLKADQGDDNADQHKVSIADGGTLTLGSKISGSFVSYLTHTPNSTVASSTTAVAGNLTVGGDLTLGSGAVISEAELEAIDGVTAGTVTASKAVIVDSNKDIASFRNVTLTGELDAGSLDISGDADIDGTLEADAMTLNGTAITATATLDTGISNNNVPKFTSGVADDDFLRVAGTAIEGRSASEVLSDIGAAPAAGSSNIVTTGALNSGSITSGFGTIDTGSSNITTTGVGSFGSLDISGDIDVDGTTNLDAVDIDGAVDIAGNLSVDGGTIKLDGNYPTGTDNTALGDGALDDGSLSGGYNVAIGKAALGENEGGQENVAVGWNSLDANTSGNNNSSLGSQSLSANTSGASNTAVGKNALRANQTGNDNVAVGQQALEDNTASNNTAVGYAAALEMISGSNNVALGKFALKTATTASNSTCVGQNAGEDVTTAVLTAVGQGAGKNITSGSGNTCIGQNAGQSVTETTESVFIGGRSDGVGAGYATTGGSNTFIGSGAGSAVTSGANNTILGRYDGNQGGLDIRGTNNYIVLSDGSGNPRLFMTDNGYIHSDPTYANTSGGTANVGIASSGQFYRSTSSLRYKNTINDATHGLTELLALRPVTYKGNNDGDTVFGGLIAEEVHDAGLTEFVTYNDENEPDALAYGNMVSLCIKAIQELKTELDAAKARIATLEAG